MDFSKNKTAFLALPKPKAVIFDWDNTLVNTWPLIQTAIDTTMEQMGQEKWGLEKVRTEVHKSMRESFPSIFGDDWHKAGEIYKTIYRAIHLNIQFLPNALALINALAELDIMQFVISNKIGATLRKEVVKLGIEQKFFAVIGASDASFDKPSKEPVELALLGSDLDPKKDEIWFIGDTITDVECAYNSGCRPIVYGYGEGGISKTIPEKLVIEGRDGDGPLPAYFDHQELIELITG